MHVLKGQSGGSRFSLFLFLLVLFLVVHVGLKVIPMYMDYSSMQDMMTTKAGVAQVLKDEEIRTDLVNKAKDLDLPLNADSFIIERDDQKRRMKISTKDGWDVEQTFLWGAYKRTFHFDPRADEGYMTFTR